MTNVQHRQRPVRTALQARRLYNQLFESLEPRTLFSATSAAGLVAQGQNQFGFDLFHQLQASGNLFISPYSIASALELTLQGAAGETARQMIQALHLPAPDLARAGMQALYQLLQANPQNSGYTLSTANSLWVKENFQLLDSFLTDTHDVLGADAFPVDFSDPEAAAGAINAWVDQQTHGKIQGIISPDSINDYTRLILANAVYFKGDWASPFMAGATHDAAFQGPDGTSSPVRMMTQTTHLGYYAQGGPDGFQAVDLPYEGGTMDMVLILPSGSSLEQFQATLNADRFADITSHMIYPNVSLSMPKFTLNETYNLGEALKNLGIRDAFGPSADFSGITQKDALSISSVVQKTFLQVDEQGTEAAAVTAITTVTSSAYHPYEPPIVFNADHPFLLVIREHTTGTILFLGRITDPGNDGSSASTDPGQGSVDPQPPHFIVLPPPWPIKIRVDSQPPHLVGVPTPLPIEFPVVNPTKPAQEPVVAPPVTTATLGEVLTVDAVVTTSAAVRQVLVGVTGPSASGAEVAVNTSAVTSSGGGYGSTVINPDLITPVRASLSADGMEDEGLPQDSAGDSTPIMLELD